jgi:hypothetical protein
MSTSEPTITQIAGGWEFTYPDGVRIQARGLGRNKSKYLTAEVDIYENQKNTTPIVGQTINLSDLKKLDGFADLLGERWVNKDWVNILVDWRKRIIQLYREGDAIEESCPYEEVEPVKYLVEPLIHENNPTIIFGEKGTAKSLLALFVAVAASLPWHDNPLGLFVPDKSISVLYIDYERTKHVFDWRLSLISSGHNLGYIPMKYLRCWQPLADIIDQLEKAKYELGIGLLIVDSLAQAAGGNINEAETAIRFHSALRRLGISSLILAQTSKDPLNRNRSVYGSTHFEYYASSVWEAKKTQEEGSPELITSLSHRRYNLSEKHSPLGFKFTFIKEPSQKEPHAIRASRTDLITTELATELDIKDRAYNLLLRHGRMESSDIAEAIGESKASVETKLYQYKEKLFVKIGKEWGAIAKGCEE